MCVCVCRRGSDGKVFRLCGWKRECASISESRFTDCFLSALTHAKLFFFYAESKNCEHLRHLYAELCYFLNAATLNERVLWSCTCPLSLLFIVTLKIVNILQKKKNVDANACGVVTQKSTLLSICSRCWGLFCITGLKPAVCRHVRAFISVLLRLDCFKRNATKTEDKEKKNACSCFFITKNL